MTGLTPLVSPDDLGTYLSADLTAVQEQARAALILGLAQTLCQAVVNPLPAGAEAVILDVAARAWTNPTNQTAKTVGPFSNSFGTIAGGLWLTRENKVLLRQLAGGGGAFTIDMLPAAAAADLPWWDKGGAILEDSGGYWW